ncbi:MAG: phosphotransferase [Acidobacteriota bacterium]
MAPDRDAAVDPQVSAWLDAVLPGAFEIETLPGDASANRFYRIRSAAGSKVLLVCADSGALVNHLSMSGFFASMDLPVARVVSSNRALGALLMDDLGDRSLCDTAAAGRGRLYLQAVDILVRLQRDAGPYRECIETPMGPYMPPTLGRQRLLWELEFFAEHYLCGVLGLAERQIAEIRARFPSLLDLLRLEPLVYCHRDYHSRNIMVVGASIYLIDLQDARWGHPLYDLASLLSDSYVDIDPALVEACKSRFRSAKRELWAGQQEFEDQFDYVAVQRNLKAIGTFGAQARLRGRQSYLQYVPRTKRLVLQRLERHELGGLRLALQDSGFFADIS